MGLTGCEDKQPKQIHWQLQLEADEDPHGAGVDQGDVPDWAARRTGVATLVWLEKATARVKTMEVDTGQQAEMEGFQVRLLGLASGLRVDTSGTFLDDENVDNPAAFVEIRRGGQLVYRGWLYVKFPELFGMDDSGWKIWLKAIRLRHAPSGADNQGTRSSAG
ncbi:MAG: DUF2155 domain-containing protein [Zetaproteobacteria bacterium]|nr:MAG: DUF2155 domain-containing protein [Zetaproteobacteria bacterium]